MMILWLVIGVTLVTVAFFLPGKNIELWPSINAAGFAAAIYLAALVAYTMRKPFPVRTRVITRVIFLATSVATVFGWIGSNTQSHWQRNKLLQIRGVIARGIIMPEMQRSLLDVLKIYYQQDFKQKEPLGQIIQRIYAPGTVGTNIHKAWGKGDSTMVYVASVSNSEVVLIGQEMNVRGRNPEFKNYNGRVGMIQERATLTAKGVKYESEN